MAGSNDTHIVEIPVDEEHQQKQITISAMQNHPLMEISESPGHLLLLKLWQREESLVANRISIKESRIDAIRSELFQLCFLFFIFHGFFLTILFTSSINHNHDHVCRSWFIPSILSISTSVFIILLVQMKVCRYWKVERELKREKGENRALTRCIQELRMKGGCFDLSKEPQNGRKMKSSSVEIKWKPLTWCYQNLLTICLLCFAAIINAAFVLTQNNYSEDWRNGEALSFSPTSNITDLAGEGDEASWSDLVIDSTSPTSPYIIGTSCIKSSHTKIKGSDAE